MPITDEIKKTLSDPTPLYAIAGAGDLAYEKLREVPAKVEALAADRKGAQEKATARLQEAQTRLVEAQAKVTETVSTLPGDLKGLQEKAQGFALQQVGLALELAVKAKEAYEELAVRGKAVVEGQQTPPTEQPAAEVEVDGEVEVVVEAVLVDFEPDLESEPAAELAPKRAPRARKSNGDTEK
ncbi:MULTISPECIES: hypothetical protein [unclassified Kitasatospora]|uniref:hypothetical protein n=1 Tax=unclassified Kitasatospora TaxID=2633591 RepID=UPI00070BE1AF|nr:MULTISPECIES: hypothetical protein [unclassified Kitasatospora]KQV18754.1 hypothetical protein ASC99_06035 [Kitasatospora sp. Root107]KRB74735.1 hypothetical protein ASE03_19970 [Kitasatospora sp. Root187]